MEILTYLSNIGTIFFVAYKSLLVRSFIFSEINTFGLPKSSKIGLALIFSSLSLGKKSFV